jgi:nitronate monooxygenase
MLGATGISLGSRLLASLEAPVGQAWKQMLVDVKAEDTVKVEILSDINSMPGMPGYGVVVRALRTPFTDEWTARRADAAREAERLRVEMCTAGQDGRLGELRPCACQSTDMARDIPPATEIVRRLVAEAEAVRSGT